MSDHPGTEPLAFRRDRLHVLNERTFGLKVRRQALRLIVKGGLGKARDLGASANPARIESDEIK